MQSALSLGATLYMPATRHDLWQVVKGEKYPELRSLVVCLEDAVAEHDLDYAKQNLKTLLLRLKNEDRRQPYPMLFVRPRHLNMAKELAQWSDISLIDGMVLPKFGLENLLYWQQAIPSCLQVMPTLESAETFDMATIRELRQALQTDFRPVLTLRIGGNDLLNCLALRRPYDLTIYQTLLGQLISNLCGQFLPYGFALSAPVFEHFSQMKLFQEELYLDIQYGLSGKTIIHPAQIPFVHQAYQVNEIELKQAQQVLDQDAQAVFSLQGSMMEPATHRRWAERILERAKFFGLKYSPQTSRIMGLEISHNEHSVMNLP
ncbi:HpcH/HpaI aldolase/citrate lyase family protein [Acinetobacter puyangensis]|uniref:HpcH/HpaI aldolase/citrate lyase family protein n=1 Tax=Acinetobacter puyangensis TaxID=1096779 RepID=UPI003A4DEC54